MEEATTLRPMTGWLEEGLLQEEEDKAGYGSSKTIPSSSLYSHELQGRITCEFEIISHIFGCMLQVFFFF